jgi:hypothetical protein
MYEGSSLSALPDAFLGDPMEGVAVFGDDYSPE